MILYQNDNLIIIENLYDPWATAGAGEYITTGTVTAQIKDTAGVNIGSAITMAYYSARGGVGGHYWIGVIEEDAALTLNAEVDIDVTATASTDRVGRWLQRHKIVRRTA